MGWKRSEMEHRGTIFYNDEHCLRLLKQSDRFVNVYHQNGAYVFGGAHKNRDIADSFVMPRHSDKRKLYTIRITLKPTKEEANVLNAQHYA